MFGHIFSSSYAIKNTWDLFNGKIKNKNTIKLLNYNVK